MESSILLKQTYDLIETIENAENEQKKEEIFDQNFEQFIQFYFDIDSQMIKYQYKDLKDEKQCEKSDKFFSIVKWILQNDKLFLRNENFGHIPNEVIRKYGDREKYHAFSLMMDGSIDEINSERNHFSKRAKIEELLKNKKELSNSQKKYLNEHSTYYKYFYGHALPYLDTHFTEIPEEEITKIINEIEDSHILDNIITSENKKLNFEDSNLAFQYITFVLKVKSVFKPQEVNNDSIIQSFWNGKIKNQQIIKYLFSQNNNEDLEKRKGIKSGQIIDYENVLKYLLEQDGWNGNNFYAELLNHFNEVGITQENVNEILKNIIPIIGTYDAAELLNETDKYPQIKNNSHLMKLLKNEEKGIIEGSTIDIPYSYALKNITNMSEEMKQNLITLMHTNLYTEDEKTILMDELKQHGIIHNDIGQEEQIKFEENDALEETISKAKMAYENRQVIPIDVAKRFLKLHSKKEISIDEESLKPCVVSIISNILNQKGIDIKSNVFLGKNESTSGVNFKRDDFKGIWINNDSIKNYIENGDMNLFITMFHEMRHSIQNRNIENGNIDYLTYNFIKENVLRKNDQDFYDFNYEKMFIEEDARQYGIIDALEFLKETDILMYEDLKKYYEELTNELNNSNISQDSNKENPFRTKEKINITDYLGRMIKNNPAILNEYNGILKIEYNLDGSTKDIASMLKEYNTLKKMDEEQHKNYYSIYYGIISSKITKDIDLPEDIEADLTEFMKEKKELVSVEDMRYYFKKEPLVTKKLLNRLLSFANIDKDNKQFEGGEHGDN